jgi:hypothetical protein
MRRSIQFFVALTVLAVSVAGAAQIDDGLSQALVDLPGDASLQVIVFLSEQADIEALDLQLKAEHASLAERNRRVILALQDVATRTQPDVAAFLDGLHGQGLVEEYRMFWLANFFWAKIKRSAIDDLVARRDLDIIYYDFEIEGERPVNQSPSGELITTHEIGLTRINAPAAWAEGWTGLGRVVMNIDTGVFGTHAALQSRFRGDVDSDGDSDESWFDPYSHLPDPGDANGHGTHTMGTICGRTPSGDTIGVAIDAQWIAAAAIDRGGGIPRTVADALLSFQWAVDPDENPNTQDNPDAIGNSWGVTTGHGYPACNETFWAVIDNCEAAGSVVIFSAGNEGPTPNSLRRPSDRGTTPYNCFAVGAVTGANQTLPIAGFSSRGPTDCGPNGEQVIKPEVVAPGVSVRSSWPGGGYQNLDGTSMASPHVTGAVAVMRQVNPDLDVDSIKRILIETAVETPADNTPGDDNNYGWGIIDLYAACVAAQSGFGVIAGVVRDGNGIPMVGVRVRIVDGIHNDDTAPDGSYYISLPAETTYTVEASFFGYIPVDTAVTVVPSDTADVDFVLLDAPGGTLQGTVIDSRTSAPIADAVVDVADTPIDSVRTDQNGFYQFASIPGGTTYSILVRAAGHSLGSDTVFIPTGGSRVLDFSLMPYESFELDDADWRGGRSWEWGTPTSGPNGAFDGTNVWATNLEGNYSNRAEDTLYSFFYSINDAVDTLIYYHWYEFENGHDGGNVAITTNDGVIWTVITPIGNYPDNQVTALENEPGYTGLSNGWRQTVFELSGYQGSVVYFRFRMSSDNSITRPGWYIDGISLSRGISWADLDPEVSVERSSFSARLAAGSSATYPLPISNSGEGILYYELQAITDTVLAYDPDGMESLRKTEISLEYEDGLNSEDIELDASKGQADSEWPYPPMLLGRGGPDAFGYIWIDSDEPNGPDFSWIDISGIGQALPMTDDDNEGPLNLGFYMPFYQGRHSTIRICSNGWLTFSSPSIAYDNRTIPTTISPNQLIAPFWDDLSPQLGGMVYFYTNSRDSAIVSWMAVPREDGNGAMTFEVILLESGHIIIQYLTMEGVLNSSTVGIEDTTGTIGLQVAYNQDYVRNNLAVLIKTPEAWLQVSPDAQRVMPGDSAQATVRFSAVDIEGGEYVGSVIVSTNDPDEASISIPCTLVVDPVGIDESVEHFPTEFSLNQNYPNPFNPSTQISFVLPTESKVELTIYDLLGRRVKRLISGRLEAGYHAATWDGTDEQGAAATSGVYFYLLKAGDFSHSRKMLLMK